MIALSEFHGELPLPDPTSPTDERRAASRSMAITLAASSHEPAWGDIRFTGDGSK
jgi:hypothetical protein